MKDWTKPFHGVTHKEGKSKAWWATVTDRGSFADLACNYPGCGFNPIKSTHDSVDAAKHAAEQWLATA